MGQQLEKMHDQKCGLLFIKDRRIFNMPMQTMCKMNRQRATVKGAQRRNKR